MFQFKVGDIVEWDSPSGEYWSRENLIGTVISHGTVYNKRQGVVKKVYDPAPERERLLALLAEGKGYPLYGDWENLSYVVESEVGVARSPGKPQHAARKTG
jgi:hypothetical protein